MTDMKLLPAPSHETIIDQNLRRMQRARNLLEVRQLVLQRNMRRMEARLPDIIDDEEAQNLNRGGISTEKSYCFRIQRLRGSRLQVRLRLKGCGRMTVAEGWPRPASHRSRKLATKLRSLFMS